MAQLKLRILLLFFFVKTLFIQTNEQNSTVKALNDTIKAEPGSDIILPCETEPPANVSTLKVEWTRGLQHVHTSVKGDDEPDEQDPWFKDRTQLFHQEMHRGNISLKLFNVTKEDEGNYTCWVPKLQSQVTEGHVKLIIEEPRIKEGHKEEPKNEDNKDSKGLSPFGISAIVIIIIIIIIIIISAIVFYKKYRRGKQPPSSKENQKNPSNEEVPLNNLPADQPTNQ